MIRVGLGYDVHPFGTEGALVIGGVTVDDAPALVGHSDADVVAHAVADALLGPTGSARPRLALPGVGPRVRGRVVDRAARRRGGPRRRTRAGGSATWTSRSRPNARSSARTPKQWRRTSPPRSRSPRQPMGRGIHVAVRPKRGEGLGFVGRAEGIAVWAVALLERAVTHGRRTGAGPERPGDGVAESGNVERRGSRSGRSRSSNAPDARPRNGPETSERFGRRRVASSVWSASTTRWPNAPSS